MKTYACPFCGEHYNRLNLDNHIQKNHENEIPNDMTSHHLAYDVINNHPDHKGKCVVCGADTNWNKKTQKYFRICKNPKCAAEIQKTYQERMLKVYNKIYLTDDPEHQKKMLQHRKISGTYKWSDGKEFGYVGSYERRFLEFLDKVLEYDSSDILTPGPTLEYEFKGKKRHWITDCLILSLNLIIEIKDGGQNINKAIDLDVRQRQIAKEKLITNQGVYSYLRLTDNDFGQLMSCIAEIKMNVMEDRVEPIFRIHENDDIEFGSSINILQELGKLYLESYMNSEDSSLKNIYAYKGIYSSAEDDINAIAIVYPNEGQTEELFLEDLKNYLVSLTTYASKEAYAQVDLNYAALPLNEDDVQYGYVIGLVISED